MITLAQPTGDVAIPQLGFGVWQVPDDDAQPAVETALEVGYRHLDTARIYGNEHGVGRAIRASGLAREELFVTTKVWNSDHGADATRAAIEGSLERLGLDRLDLYLIHWPTPEQDRYSQTWSTLLQLREEGLARAVGVCNFHVDHLKRLRKDTGELPVINQVELHPYLQQSDLRDFHVSHDIITEAWSPLASGRKVLDDLAVRAIADAHGATPAQVILAWHRQNGFVVIPKSVTPRRIQENFDSLGVTLSDAEMLTMTTLDRGMRTGPDPAEFNHR
ncbi:MAG: aldo/keto reductase [Intrasporangiaceae bacterium]|mgnify:CR=1 FL=1|nr:aldo/keto reductase [Intrasporangiaceae bacterium]